MSTHRLGHLWKNRLLHGVMLAGVHMQRARTEFSEPSRLTLSNIKAYPRYETSLLTIPLSVDQPWTNLQIAGIVWRQLSPEIKILWELEAEEERNRHAKAHPTYRYKPRQLAQRDQGMATDGRPIGRRAQKPMDPKAAHQHIAIATKILNKELPCGPQITDMQEHGDSDVDGEELML